MEKGTWKGAAILCVLALTAAGMLSVGIRAVISKGVEFVNKRSAASSPAKEEKPTTSQWITPNPPPFETVKEPQQPVYDEEELEFATLHALRGKIDDRLDDGDVKDNRSNRAQILEQVRLARYKLKCVSDWSDRLPEGQVKKHYQSWISYYSQRYDKAEEKANSPAVVPDDSYWDKTQRAIRGSEKLNIPKPKICVGQEITQ